jgi:hypothetical protein
MPPSKLVYKAPESLSGAFLVSRIRDRLASKKSEPTSGLEPLTCSSYELGLCSHTKTEKSLPYSEKRSQRIAVLRPMTPW